MAGWREFLAHRKTVTSALSVAGFVLGGIASLRGITDPGSNLLVVSGLFVVGAAALILIVLAFKVSGPSLGAATLLTVLAVALVSGVFGYSLRDESRTAVLPPTTTTTAMTVAPHSTSTSTASGTTSGTSTSTSTTVAPNLEGAIYLSEVTPSRSGGLLDKGQMEVGGELMMHAIAVDANGLGCTGGCNVDYKLPGDAKRFVATMGRFGTSTSAENQLWVYADDTRLATIDVPLGKETVVVDVDVKGRQLLQLRGSTSNTRVVLGEAAVTTR